MTPDTVCPPVSNRSIDYFDREFAIEFQRMSARLSFFALFTDVFLLSLLFKSLMFTMASFNDHYSTLAQIFNRR